MPDWDLTAQGFRIFHSHFLHKVQKNPIYLREKIELQQEKEYERKYITASMTGEQDAERLI